MAFASIAQRGGSGAFLFVRLGKPGEPMKHARVTWSFVMLFAWLSVAHADPPLAGTFTGVGTGKDKRQKFVGEVTATFADDGTVQIVLPFDCCGVTIHSTGVSQFADRVAALTFQNDQAVYGWEADNIHGTLKLDKTGTKGKLRIHWNAVNPMPFFVTGATFTAKGSWQADTPS